MLTVREKVELLLEHLSLEMERGVGCLEVVKAINLAGPEEKLVSGTTFIGTVHEACEREALLSLAKLLIAEAESISVDYLLNCALEVPGKVFPHASRVTLEAAVSRHRRQLAEREALRDDLKARRDRMLAHLDRKHVNDPEVLPSGAVDWEAIEAGFEIAGEIINACRGYFGMPALALDEVRQGLRGELTDLVDWARHKD